MKDNGPEVFKSVKTLSSIFQVDPLSPAYVVPSKLVAVTVSLEVFASIGALCISGVV